jgi:large subunit ribosomal protein L13
MARNWQVAASGAGRYHPASFVPPPHREAKFRWDIPTGTSPTTHPSRQISAMKTFSAKSETVQRDWYLVDATGKTLGRLASELARRLRGKHKPVYTPHVDTGDYLIVVNAEKIHVTGNKLADKKYHRFTGYVGNLKTETLGQALQRHPERVIEIAVKGMLPKNPLGRAMYRKLKVYKGAEHPHAAQQPQILDI